MSEENKTFHLICILIIISSITIFGVLDTLERKEINHTGTSILPEKFLISSGSETFLRFETSNQLIEPLIRVSSKDTNVSAFYPPYDVELSKDCKPVTCKCSDWGCVAYCFVCDELSENSQKEKAE